GGLDPRDRARGLDPAVARRRGGGDVEPGALEPAADGVDVGARGRVARVELRGAQVLAVVGAARIADGLDLAVEGGAVAQAEVDPEGLGLTAGHGADVVGRLRPAGLGARERVLAGCGRG